MNTKHAVKQLINTLLEPTGFQLSEYEEAIAVAQTLRQHCDIETINQLVDIVLLGTGRVTAEWVSLAVTAARMGISQEKRELLLGLNTRSLIGTIMSLEEILSIAKMGVSREALEGVEDYISSAKGHCHGGYEKRQNALLELRRLREIPW